MNQELLKQVLHYDPNTGVFTWLQALSNRIKVGDVAGSYSIDGYIKIKCFGKYYQAHRLAWFYVHGCWPDLLDHIDRSRDNNRLCNLRDTTRSINMHNSGERRGWCYNSRKPRTPYRVEFHNNNKVRTKHFRTLEEAEYAYNKHKEAILAAA